jgi:hypothetical protein
MKAFISYIKLLFLAQIVFLTSCKTYKSEVSKVIQNDPLVGVNSPSVLIKPILADIEIGKESKTVVYSTNQKLSYEYLLENAKFKFITSEKCDLIVSPTFKIKETKENANLVEVIVEVSGYPATYTRMYQADKVDESILTYNSLKFVTPQSEFISNITNNQPENRSFISFYAGTVFGAGVGLKHKIKPLSFYGALESDILSRSRGYDINFIVERQNGLEQEYMAKGSGQNNYSLGTSYDFVNKRNSSISVLCGVNYSTLDVNDISIGSGLVVSNLSTVGIRVGLEAHRALSRDVKIFVSGFSNLNFLDVGPKNDFSKVSQFSSSGGINNLVLGLNYRF